MKRSSTMSLVILVLLVLLIVGSALAAEEKAAPTCKPCANDATAQSFEDGKPATSTCVPRPKADTTLYAFAPSSFDLGIWSIGKAKRESRKFFESLLRLVETPAYADQACPGDCGSGPSEPPPVCPDAFWCDETHTQSSCCTGGGCGCVNVDRLVYDMPNGGTVVGEIYCDVYGGCTGCTQPCKG